MKLLYAANIRLPTEKAHGVQIMKMCEAFADVGVEVELVVPRRKNHLTSDPFDYYVVKRNFTITYVTAWYSPSLGRVGFWLTSFLFAERVASRVWQTKPDIVYSRDEFTLINLYLWRVKCVWETHTGAWNLLIRLGMRRFFKVVTISKGLADMYIGKGIDPKKIVTAHDGVDLKQFEVTVDTKSVKERLQVPLDKKIVLYIGHLYGWKGVDALLEASRLLSPDAQVVIIGGTDTEVSILAKKYPDVIFVGYRPYTELPANQKIGDVLVIPNSAKSVVSRLYTSPLKLFAHMASGVPIVASDLPSIREVLSEHSACLVGSDNPEAFADGITQVLSDKVLARQLSDRAFSEIKKYTWHQRAQRIIDFLDKKK
jgi:glycosyltransferase involved in cell wall biosynthesis